MQMARRRAYNRAFKRSNCARLEATVFDLDTSQCSFDTTSVNVWGDYNNSLSGKKAPHITYGYSKDKRPDLKQFMVSMLCVEGNIPISGKMQNGNSSDETLNNEELQRIAKLLKPLEENIGELTYIADCKLITTGNSWSDACREGSAVRCRNMLR